MFTIRVLIDKSCKAELEQLEGPQGLDLRLGPVTGLWVATGPVGRWAVVSSWAVELNGKVIETSRRRQHLELSLGSREFWIRWPDTDRVMYYYELGKHWTGSYAYVDGIPPFCVYGIHECSWNPDPGFRDCDGPQVHRLESADMPNDRDVW